MNHISDAKIRVKFDGGSWKQEKVTFNHKTMVNIYVVYKINLWRFNLDNKQASWNSLFRDVKLTKNTNPDKYSYSEYGIGFDAHGTFSLSH